MSDTIYYSQPYEKVVIERVVEVTRVTPVEVERTAEVPPPSICKSYLDENCSCMVYLQDKGIPIYGDAIEIEPNYFGIAERGDVIIFRYPNGKAHTALNEETYTDVYYVSEDNFYEGRHSERIIPIDSTDIYGIWRDYTENLNNPVDNLGK